MDASKIPLNQVATVFSSNYLDASCHAQLESNNQLISFGVIWLFYKQFPVALTSVKNYHLLIEDVEFQGTYLFRAE